MTTSSTTSATLKTKGGQCVVCGKETYLRCEACSRFGIDWMFFCSVEHQRLIWKVHRFVCGPRSNPFTFPGFTETEIKRAKDLWEVKEYRERFKAGIVERGIERGLALSKSFKEHPKELRESYFRSVDDLQDRGVDKPLSKEEQRAVFELRDSMADRALSDSIERYPMANDAGTAVIHATTGLPFAFVLGSGLVDFEKYIEGQGPAWWSDYLHRRLIFLELYSALPSIDNSYIVWQGKMMVKFAKEVVGKNDPSAAETIIRKFTT
ncbi:hypothetical protein JCM3765_002563 [Sporobolomyces pararoseus]